MSVCFFMNMNALFKNWFSCSLFLSSALFIQVSANRHCTYILQHCFLVAVYLKIRDGTRVDLTQEKLLHTPEHINFLYCIIWRKGWKCKHVLFEIVTVHSVWYTRGFNTREIVIYSGTIFFILQYLAQRMEVQTCSV